MYENNKQTSDVYLIDEALTSEPIRNSFRLGWEFITLNRKFTLTALVIFILLNILGMIPAIALIFMVLSAIFGMAIQIHVGRTFYLADGIKSYIHQIKESSLETILNRHTATASGAYMGWVVLFFILLFFLSIIAGSMGLISENMNESDLINLMLTLGFPLLLVALFISYVQPLVQANIVMSDGFGAGFKAVFTLFSMNLWRSALQKSYFKYVAIFGTVIMLALFLFISVISILITFSGIPLLGNILFMVGIYIFMVMMVIGSMMAKRVCSA